MPKNKEYFNYIHRLPPQKLGSKEIPKGNKECLCGMKFVITGVLETIERDSAVKLIRDHGGEVMTTLSKKIKYLVVGRDPGKIKLKKAEIYGIKVINEDELFQLIKDSVIKDDHQLISATTTVVSATGFNYSSRGEDVTLNNYV